MQTAGKPLSPSAKPGAFPVCLLTWYLALMKQPTGPGRQPLLKPKDAMTEVLNNLLNQLYGG